MMSLLVAGSNDGVRKRSLLTLLSAVLLPTLLVHPFGHTTRHNHIEITSRRTFVHQRTVRGPLSRHRGGLVGVPAACRALCVCCFAWLRGLGP